MNAVAESAVSSDFEQSDFEETDIPGDWGSSSETETIASKPRIKNAMRRKRTKKV